MLHSDLVPLISAYRTCEFATLAKDGTPIMWPTAAWPTGDGDIVVTTSLGFPQKAFNVRRDGRVALLFSDPTGSGLDAPDQVNVSGTATCPDEIVTTPGDLADYWAMIFERQPDSRAYLRPVLRPMTDWYYLRLIITITPGTVTTRRPLPPADATPPSGSRIPGASIVDQFASGVLGTRDADGAPVLTRVRPVAGDTAYRIDAPHDLELRPGPASLLVHRHDERLSKLRFALVRGALTGEPGDWSLTPSQVVDPARSTLGTLRLARRNARGYLARRGLSRPRVDWRAFGAIAG